VNGLLQGLVQWMFHPLQVVFSFLLLHLPSLFCDWHHNVDRKRNERFLYVKFIHYWPNLLGLPSPRALLWCLTKRLPSKILYTVLISPVLTTCPAKTSSVYFVKTNRDKLYKPMGYTEFLLYFYLLMCSIFHNLYMIHPRCCNNHNIYQYLQLQPTHTSRTTSYHVIIFWRGLVHAVMNLWAP
jgi:hypothetical protein